MSTWDAVDHYFSGQGVVLLAERDANGNPMGFESVGNVSDLKISVSTSSLEHKESHTGQRGTDLRLTTEVKCALSMTMENFVAENLARVSRGLVTSVAGASVVAQSVKAYFGKVSTLGRINVSAVAVKIASTAMTAYVNDSTAWDYKLNADAGSIQINDGSVAALALLGANGTLALTGITAGATTTLTGTNTLKVGQKVVVGGVTGADAAFINGKVMTVVTATGASVTTDLNTTGKTIVGTSAKVFADGDAVAVDYTYAAQKEVDGLTTGSKELFMRFEGLNTADENDPVIVEVFKFSTDPFKELALIGDGVQSFVLEGSVLADTTRATGSKYFKVTKSN